MKRLFAATPLFATAAGTSLIGMTLILAALQMVEVGCLIMRPDE